MNFVYFTRKDKMICLGAMLGAILLITLGGMSVVKEGGFAIIIMTFIADAFLLIFIPFAIFHTKSPNEIQENGDVCHE